MISSREFRKYAHEFVDWMADYYENIEAYPVKSKVKPGEIKSLLPEYPPAEQESIDAIFKDFKEIILPGMTHWQNPSWFAYFQANSSYPSILAEMLTATLGAQCMSWETSPAATELEERVLEWLKSAMGLPENFTGVIQDTASTSTLVALLSAREKYSDYSINKKGFSGQEKFRVYCSTETHSSIDKDVKIAGFGHDNLVKIPVDKNMAMVTAELDKAITSDRKNNMTPLCVIATIGTTGTMAIDSLKDIAAVCEKHSIWLHVDAAYAGSAMILPEYRWMIKGLEKADSYVFNPHKWLFTNFDLSAYYVKDKDHLIRTFSILPEYLKTAVDSQVNNYRDWGIQLGRRFRALKLWFVFRNFGISEIRTRMRNHIQMVRELAEKMKREKDIEFLAPVSLNMICFRFNPGNMQEDALNILNQKILKEINNTGELYMTHTRIEGRFTIRLVAGQTYLEKRHLEKAWKLIRHISRKLAGDHA